MEDFLEIADDLQECGGAITVHSAEELQRSVQQIIDSETLHRKMSEAARMLVDRNSGVIQNHIRELNELLPVEQQ